MSAIQIRVLAEAAEQDMRAAWPRLWGWIFSRPQQGSGRKNLSEFLAALHDFYQFGDVEPALREALKEALPAILAQWKEVERHLADWDPKAAHVAACALEDMLDSLEERVPEP